MILTVTLNTALDITHQVPRLVPYSSHVATAVHARAGGKGVNVARVLSALGMPALVTGLAGGATGRQIRAELAEAGLPDALFAVAGDSRRTLTVAGAEDGDATVFNEPGPPITAPEWAAFQQHYAGLLTSTSVVVLAGSLPPGLPVDAYAGLVRAAAAAGCRTVLDTTGEALLAGAAAGPDVVKPNAAELRTATGCPDTLVAAGLLRARGARAVVASLGPDGLCAVTPDGTWRAAPPEQLPGNPTGAGDACVAALAAGLAAGTPWPETVREAVALSAAAVLCPVAGGFDPPTYRRLRTAVPVQEIHVPRHQ
ncbi:hexose kinase [Kitasatospora sp. NBC_00240]|uniref:1-phosphofructokinase family hexose kinase n=1 Tax=Kitasatospora sp. NBC_00240 TaxID=2903567 RepID=UPI0022527661|nr:hexose kinase [Kitasatospora sp. NBC_00240]MCX5213235.1 hexose kinase [Kitasatospora sp. NBC_00240]